MRDAGKIRVMIDPGHGGDDPGAVHHAAGLREADVALRIATVLKAIADMHPELDAALTRETDRPVALRARTDLANGRDVLGVIVEAVVGKLKTARDGLRGEAKAA